jgi:hypothetical protein
MRRFIRPVIVSGIAGLLCLLTVAPAQATHPRPAGATPMRMSLVPGYAACGAPNRTHGPPLAFPSCNPPVQTSAQATVGTPDAFGGAASFTGFIRYDVLRGSPDPSDFSDVIVEMGLTGVRCAPAGVMCGSANASGPADYSGEVQFAWTTRMSDHFNAVAPGGGNHPATVQDASIERAVACAETASTSTGSTCNVTTTVNAIIPGSVKHIKRSVWEYADVRVYDGGADGDGDTTADNTVFLRPGVFIP